MRINRLIKPLHIQCRDSLSKVGLDTIDTLVEEAIEAPHIPLDSIGVSEVDETHARLP